VVAGSFQPFLEALRGHEVTTLQVATDERPDPARNDRGPDVTDTATTAPPTDFSTPRLLLMRFGYLVLGGGLLVTVWPEVLNPDKSWPLMEGVVNCMLAALSALALLGLRYPVRMLPLLLFECAWKLLWLGAVAVPLWRQDRMDAAAQEVAQACFWVVIILAVVPWNHVYRQYVTRPGEPWRRPGR
jgi:hypothetical protein